MIVENIGQLKKFIEDLPDDAPVGTFRQGVGRPKNPNITPMAINERGYTRWLIDDAEPLRTDETLGFGII